MAAETTGIEWRHNLDSSCSASATELDKSAPPAPLLRSVSIDSARERGEVFFGGTGGTSFIFFAGTIGAIDTAAAVGTRAALGAAATGGGAVCESTRQR